MTDKKLLQSLKKILCDNEWFTQEEIEKYFTDEICECICECASPDRRCIFNAFNGLPPRDVKVLILGQDPYPDNEKAHGLAFSYKNGNTPAEDSLKNIFDKIKENLNIGNDFTDLTYWKEQGVLLINTAFTYVKDENQKSHSKNEKKHINAWKPFTNLIISKLLEYKKEDKKPLVIMLWGVKANEIKPIAYTQNKKANEIKPITYTQNKDEHCPFPIIILRSSHPSHRGYNKSIYNHTLPAFNDRNYKPFTDCNEFLKTNGVDEIDWHTK